MGNLKQTTKQILAIIPARGGSKGVPRKNIRPLAGKPLICYTIEAAKRACLVNRIVVTTDDDEIATVSRKAGAEVVRRPAELALDTSPTEPALLHALGVLKESEGYEPYAVVLLQPTSPLRGAKRIDEAVQKLLSTGADAVLSVCESQHYNLCATLDGDRYCPFYDYNNRPRTQDVENRYRENGAIYVTRTEVLIQHQNRLAGDVRAIVMNIVESIDIDSEEDFALAEQVLYGYKPD